MGIQRTEDRAQAETAALAGLVTEQGNPATAHIDRLPTLEALRLINAQDALVAGAVEKELPAVAEAVDEIYEKVSAGGRLVYCGAGTSGRLGVMDAAECWPTYGAKNVIGLIAGGRDALLTPQEGTEDSPELCRQDLVAVGFSAQDALVGVAASGRTPYVLGGLEYANSLGALTVSLSCNPGSPAGALAQIAIAPVVGPEAVAGSTRMKAGTAQKMVLNMLSTELMIRLGKVYGNRMVDLRPTNEKLYARAQAIVMQAAGAGREEARRMLLQTGWEVKTAIVAILAGTTPDGARALLKKAKGRVADAVGE